MNTNIVILASRVLLALALSVGLALAEETPQLLKLKHTVLSPASEQVVLQLNGSYSPKVFTLKDETPRVIFDFADMTHSREVKSITTGGSIVKRVRVGMHGDDAPKTRIVFDVVTLKDVTYTQNFDAQTSTLTVRFTRPEKAAESKKVAAKEKQDNQPVATAAKPEGTASETAAETAAATAAEPQATAAPVATAAQLPEPKVDQERQTASPSPSSVVASEAPAAPVPTTPPAPVTPAPADKAVAPPAVTAEQQVAPPPQPPVVQPPAQPEPSKGTEEAQAKPEEEKPAQKPAPAKAAEVTQESKADSAAPQEPPAPEAATPPQATATSEAAKPERVPTTESAKATAPAKPEDGPQLEYVKFDPSSPKGEMVLFKLNGFHPPAVHGVEEGIPRVVCDFNNTKLINAGDKVIKANGQFVKAIRTSKTKKPEKVRVVIDLEPNRSYDLQQVFFKEDNLFVIIVNTIKK